MQNYYTEATSNLERYIKTYPNHKNIIYAHYLIAMCYYESIEDEKRGSAPLIKAKNKFDYIHIIIFYYQKFQFVYKDNK